MNVFPSSYEEMIYKRTYARWMEDWKRRENWEDSVNRYGTFFYERGIPKGLNDMFFRAIDHLKDFQVMGSMRTLWTAGPALDVENAAGFNCGYTPIESTHDLATLMYLLMNGIGVGISVEGRYIQQLPKLPIGLGTCTIPIVFEDSKKGWAEGYHKFLRSIFEEAMIPQYDLSKIRPKGSPLKTFGGRASGPGPLKDLLDFTTDLVIKARGRRLLSDEIADLCCKISQIVVVGGTRRSAIIILSDPWDTRMARYKTGTFWDEHPYRSFANISSVYSSCPTPEEFSDAFTVLRESGTGERGFINRDSLQFRVPFRRDPNHLFGLNPCGEVILRPREFCNLSEVVVRPGDDLAALIKKIQSAVLFGCLQASLTDYHFISDEWTKNSEEERLLGVSLTGIHDRPLTNHELLNLVSQAIWTAKRVSRELGIPMPAAVTCVKPSGTVSQLVNSASGMHPRHAPYYIRRVRVAANDPVAKFMMTRGVPYEPDRMDGATMVFDFPIKSPERAITRHQLTATDQLKLWTRLKVNYTEHNPSCTIYVRDNEWDAVEHYLWDHWALIGGITLLPYDGGHYQQAPYEDISEQQYEKLSKEMPELDWNDLAEFEDIDNTTGAQELACVGGSCELN